jgi:hypothetical protein
MSNLSRERLAQLFSYDPETGHFIRLPGGSYRPKGGDVAGCIKSDYVVIRVDGVLYRAHRLAFLYMTGAWPENEVDHLNGIKSDNRWKNLRDVTLAENRQNQIRARKNSKTGLLGAHFDTNRNQFKAEICISGKNRNLGYFDTAADAHAAYLKAKRENHTGNTL